MTTIDNDTEPEAHDLARFKAGGYNETNQAGDRHEWFTVKEYGDDGKPIDGAWIKADSLTTGVMGEEY